MRAVIYPSDWLFRRDPPPMSDFARRFLAEGDSWFTIGTVNLLAASNILLELEFAQSTAIINCAYPGDTLQHVVDTINDPYFDRLLRVRNFASYWEAIVLSAGGNDLIDAAELRSVMADGSSAPLDARLLLTPAEAAVVNAGAAGPARFVSEAGWQRLARYLVENFRLLVARRDRGPSAGRPIFMHTYAVPTVRPSGTPKKPNGWLYPALAAYGIAQGEQQGVATELFDRLRALILSLDSSSNDANALAHFHVFDSARLAGLVPAQADATGISGDWVNEVHPSPSGYAKIGSLMGQWIDGVLATYPWFGPHANARHRGTGTPRRSGDRAGTRPLSEGVRAISPRALNEGRNIPTRTRR